MTEEEAITILQRHSLVNVPVEEVERSNSFVYHLRPFDKLRVGHFDEIVLAIEVLSSRISANDEVVLPMLWRILNEGYRMGLSSRGDDYTLPNIGRISDEEMATLQYYLFCVGYATMGLLSGAELESALEPHKQPWKFLNKSPAPIPGLPENLE